MTPIKVNGVINMIVCGSVKSRIAILLVEYPILLVYLTHFGSKIDCFMSTMNQAFGKSS